MPCFNFVQHRGKRGGNAPKLLNADLKNIDESFKSDPFQSCCKCHQDLTLTSFETYPDPHGITYAMCWPCAMDEDTPWAEI